MFHREVGWLVSAVFLSTRNCWKTIRILDSLKDVSVVI